MSKRWLFLVVPVLAVVGYGLYLAAEAGEFRTVENLRPGACRAVPGLPGPEDIAVHPVRDVAYVSSFDRRAALDGDPRPGAIFRIGPHGAGPVNLVPDAGPDFRPHGISLHVDPVGRETLFVVNHPGEALFGDAPAGYQGPAHTIEVFDVAGDRLVHRARLADPLLVRPNDIVAIDDVRFYVTNDHGSDPGPMRKVEDYLRLPWANVVYYDGEGFREVADGLTYANGINRSRDGGRVWVAEVTRSRIREYRRDPETGALTEARRVDVGFGVDNISVDRASGDLWLAGHVKLLQFARHAANETVHSPSRVKRLRFDGEGVRQETVFVDDGGLLSGASVAVHRNGRLLIGAVFSPHLVACAIDVR